MRPQQARGAHPSLPPRRTLRTGAAVVANGLLALPLDKRPASVSWPEPPATYLTRSFNKYGEKNGKAVSATSSFLGRKCSRSPLRKAEHDASRDFPLQDMMSSYGGPRPSRSRVRSPDSSMQQLSPRDWARANNLAKKLSGLWSVIQPSNSFGRRRCNLWNATNCGLRTLFSWRRRWNGVNTLLTTESF